MSKPTDASERAAWVAFIEPHYGKPWPSLETAFAAGRASRDAEIKSDHCQDCCCAQSWNALGIPNKEGYTGDGIVAEIKKLREGITAAEERGRAEGLTIAATALRGEAADWFSAATCRGNDQPRCRAVAERYEIDAAKLEQMATKLRQP